MASEGSHRDQRAPGIPRWAHFYAKREDSELRAERLEASTVPTKPPPRSRHECSVDSGTNEQIKREFCLKSQLPTYRHGQTINGLNVHTAVLVWLFLRFLKCVFSSRKPRGVRSKRIRQKERLVRYETPPSAAGGGTPGENRRTKAEDETRDSGLKHLPNLPSLALVEHLAPHLAPQTPI